MCAFKLIAFVDDVLFAFVANQSLALNAVGRLETRENVAKMAAAETKERTPEITNDAGNDVREF